jgi:hypothetical protein
MRDPMRDPMRDSPSEPVPSAPPARLWRAALAGGLVAVTIPLWPLPLMLVPRLGFVVGLLVWNVYYAVPGVLFGRRLFPVEEFGFIPEAAGIAVAALFYLLLGALVGVLLAMRRRRRTAGTEAAGRVPVES